jgi:tripartite-type tricarboxylate transporter receptor subunit TctC
MDQQPNREPNSDLSHFRRQNLNFYRPAWPAKYRTLRCKVIALSLAAPLFIFPTAQAQSNDVSRFVVPFPPGGTVDNLARLFAQKMAASGQKVIVENKPGANATLAVQAVLQAPADGRTFLFTTPSAVASNVALFKALPYDPLKDLVPVARLFRTHSVLVTGSSSPYNSFADVVAAHKSGKQLSFASGATGYQVMFEHIRRASGINAVVASYKGTLAALLDVSGGVVDLSVADPTAVYPLIKGGKLRALAVINETRDPQLPGVPTSIEAGAGTAPLYQWMGVFAKAGTPPDAIEKMRKQLGEAAKDPGVVESARINATFPFWGDAEALAAQQRSEIQLYRDLMKSANMEQQ